MVLLQAFSSWQFLADNSDIDWNASNFLLLSRGSRQLSFTWCSGEVLASPGGSKSFLFHLCILSHVLPVILMHVQPFTMAGRSSFVAVRHQDRRQKCLLLYTLVSTLGSYQGRTCGWVSFFVAVKCLGCLCPQDVMLFLASSPLNGWLS